VVQFSLYAERSGESAKISVVFVSIILLYIITM
jgi:hypothetical protein